MRVNIKALSVNKSYRGRRFKTPEYIAYEKELMYTLPNIEVPKGELEIHIEAGMSNISSDIDNVAKPFIDICQKRYGFNDRWVMKLTMVKKKVKKGEEYIDFNIG
jgi:Holliday junction resolvase RusA-like endonuclease